LFVALLSDKRLVNIHHGYRRRNITSADDMKT